MRTVFSMLLFLTFGVTSLYAQQPSGRAVMEANKAAESARDESAEVSMTLVNDRGQTREREVVVTSKTAEDGTRRLLVRFRAPADVAGTGFLSIERRGREDDAWLYLPALRKTRRIAGTDRQDRFVGSDFTYEDLAPEKLDDHSYRLAGSETVDGTEAWVVEAAPKDPATTGYGRRRLWIGKDRGLLLQTELYDHDGVLAKRLRAGDARQVPGTDRWRAYQLTMEDLAAGSRTVLVFSDYAIDRGVPDDYFSERYLRRPL